MPVQSVNIPKGLKKQLERRLERDDYQNASEFIREAIRDKLKDDKALHPEEIQRIMDIKQREDKENQEWISKDEMLERLDIDESDI